MVVKSLMILKRSQNIFYAKFVNCSHHKKVFKQDSIDQSHIHIVCLAINLQLFILTHIVDPD